MGGECPLVVPRDAGEPDRRGFRALIRQFAVLVPAQEVLCPRIIVPPEGQDSRPDGTGRSRDPDVNGRTSQKHILR